MSEVAVAGRDLVGGALQHRVGVLQVAAVGALHDGARLEHPRHHVRARVWPACRDHLRHRVVVEPSQGQVRGRRRAGPPGGPASRRRSAGRRAACPRRAPVLRRGCRPGIRPRRGYPGPPSAGPPAPPPAGASRARTATAVPAPRHTCARWTRPCGVARRRPARRRSPARRGPARDRSPAASPAVPAAMPPAPGRREGRGLAVPAPGPPRPGGTRRHRMSARPSGQHRGVAGARDPGELPHQAGLAHPRLPGHEHRVPVPCSCGGQPRLQRRELRLAPHQVRAADIHHSDSLPQPGAGSAAVPPPAPNGRTRDEARLAPHLCAVARSGREPRGGAEHGWK